VPICDVRESAFCGVLRKGADCNTNLSWPPCHLLQEVPIQTEPFQNFKICFLIRFWAKPNSTASAIPPKIVNEFLPKHESPLRDLVSNDQKSW
jgi:hypothetical protein